MTEANSSARIGTTPTARELQILRAWASAGSVRRAALDLGITVNGVDAMLANVRARAGVRRTWQAALKYLEEYRVRG